MIQETTKEEQILIAQVLEGNHQAFALLIDLYKTPVYNLCLRLLHQTSDAEDAAQETFLRAYLHIADYQCDRGFRTWLLAIAAHHCIDLIRQRRIHLVSIEEVIGRKQNQEDEPEMWVLKREKEEIVRSVLRKLPAKYQIVVVLRYFYDMSYEEIAQATGITLGNVKSRLFRARNLVVNMPSGEGSALERNLLYVC